MTVRTANRGERTAVVANGATDTGAGGAAGAAGADRTVLVAGAGPVGLTVALVLADAGVHVKVFEAAAELPDDPRASTFHPPTLEMFERFGVTEALHREGVICDHWQIRWHPSGERAVFDLAAIADETRFPYRLQVEQWKLVRAVHALVSRHPKVELVLGAPVTAVEQDAAGVTITVERDGRPERVRGAWLVGADGAHSFVRKAIGETLEGSTYPETILIVETRFPFEDHLEQISRVSYVWREGGNFSMFRVPDRWRVGMYPLAGMSNEEQLADANVERFLQGIVPRDVPYEVLAKRPYRTHNRIVRRYRVGRVFLAGDAAHLNSPTGGMGLNGGLHDAFNLAEKLAAVVGGRADAALLDRYERQRRPIAQAEILAQADRNRARMREPDPARRREMLADLQALARDPVRLKAHLMRTSMIDGVRQAARIE